METQLNLAAIGQFNSIFNKMSYVQMEETIRQSAVVLEHIGNHYANLTGQLVRRGAISLIDVELHQIDIDDSILLRWRRRLQAGRRRCRTGTVGINCSFIGCSTPVGQSARWRMRWGPSANRVIINIPHFEAADSLLQPTTDQRWGGNVHPTVLGQQRASVMSSSFCQPHHVRFHLANIGVQLGDPLQRLTEILTGIVYDSFYLVGIA